MRRLCGPGTAHLVRRKPRAGFLLLTAVYHADDFAWPLGVIPALSGQHRNARDDQVDGAVLDHHARRGVERRRARYWRDAVTRRAEVDGIARETEAECLRATVDD